MSAFYHSSMEPNHILLYLQYLRVVCGAATCYIPFPVGSLDAATFLWRLHEFSCALPGAFSLFTCGERCKQACNSKKWLWSHTEIWRLYTYHQRNMLIVLRSINLPRQLDNLFGTEVLKIAAKEYRKVSILYSEEETRKIAYQAHDCKVKLRTITITFDKCHLHLYFSPFSSYYDNLAKCYELFMRKGLWMLADRAIQDHKSLNSENIICQIQIKYPLELVRKH